MLVIEFTDQNFKTETAKGFSVVDLYADWCVSPETIISSSRGGKQASSIIKDDNLLSYYGNKLIHKPVTYSVTSNRLGHCLKISTEANRSIRVTDDHRFFTPRGWKKAIALKEGDRIAALPLSGAVFSNKVLTKKKNIILPSDIRKHIQEQIRGDVYIEELKTKALLPLPFNHPKLPIIARLMGALFSDGTLYQLKKTNYREISFVLGQEQDADDVMNDLEELGFFRIHKNERFTKNKFQGREWISHSYRVRCLATSLWLFFKALGVPVGRKVDKAYRVPIWIFAAPDLVKQQFLAGYLGGDGPKITIRAVSRKKRQPYNHIHINDLEFYKREDLQKSGVTFAKDLQYLFQAFGVKTSRIFSEKTSYFRKDGTRSTIIHIRFKSNVESAYALARIGYAYCRQKRIAASYASEFLQRILARRIAWKEIWQKVIKLSQNLSPSRIAKQLGVSKGTVASWIYNKKIKPTVFKTNELFEDWIKKAIQNLSDGFVWDHIQKIEPIYLPSVQKITVNKSHNFIANGILSHNCGPCRMMAPVFEEVAKQFEGKVKMGKLNVDDNTETPGQFGVASIPTLIFLKDGKEVGRLTGFQTKDALTAKLNELGVK